LDKWMPMPELPEVEIIVRGLKEALKNMTFQGLAVYLEKCLESPRSLFPRRLLGKRILDVERRGKHILLRITGGTTLRIHLRMTGRLQFVPGHTPLEKHTHIVFSFRNHSHQLRFTDSRQFGRLWLERNGSGGELSSLADLGPEPLEISAADFVARTRSKGRAIKALLLDQHFLAGVGNIYADEALHRAGIHPQRRAASLREKTLLGLHRALRQILQQAIRRGGTSVRTYVNSRGEAGAFQKFLKVYGREGSPCMACGTGIVRQTIGGRGSFFCPRCQRRPRAIKDSGGRLAPKHFR
jgi:formamidopyrimidine-DNA glycosylase